MGTFLFAKIFIETLDTPWQLFSVVA